MKLNKLYEMAEEFHIDVHDFQMQCTPSQSQMIEDGSCHIAIDKKQMNTNAQEKVVLSHEIGHCVTGSFYNRYSQHDIKSRHENRANKKAAHLLVPLDKLINAIEEGYDNVWELAEYFEITETFMRKALMIYKDDLRMAYEEKC